MSSRPSGDIREELEENRGKVLSIYLLKIELEEAYQTASVSDELEEVPLVA